MTISSCRMTTKQRLSTSRQNRVENAAAPRSESPTISKTTTTNEHRRKARANEPPQTNQLRPRRSRRKKTSPKTPRCKQYLTAFPLFALLHLLHRPQTKSSISLHTPDTRPLNLLLRVQRRDPSGRKTAWLDSHSCLPG